MSLKNKKITVGLTGGIAAYKTPILIRLLIKAGADVRAIMTESAGKFITELTIETVCRNPVTTDMFPAQKYVGTHHIDMASWPDLFVIAPATANFIAKTASGICDDLLTTVICAAKCPVIICPAMNTTMYQNPITQKNIEFLKTMGYRFINPGEGNLACEESGPGRLAEPDEIFSEIESFFSKKKVLKDRKVLVTAGPCREAIDPVRFISNHSSGKMGYALAEAAYDMGAEVTLVSGPTSLSCKRGIKFIPVETTAQMQQAVKREFKNSDILVMAAAPADFTINKPSAKKIKKGGQSLTLEFVPTEDILLSLKDIKKPGQKIIGFALETDNGVKNAKAKLKAKGLDMIVLNSLENTRPFGGDKNKATIILKNGRSRTYPQMSKKELAEIILRDLIH